MSKSKLSEIPMPNIDGMTKDQLKKLHEYAVKYRDIGISTKPGNKKKAEKAILKLEKLLDEKEGIKDDTVPKFTWVKSPLEGATLAAQRVKGKEDVTEEEIKEMFSKASYSQYEAYWISFYTFVTKEMKKQNHPIVTALNEVIQDAGVFWTLTDEIIVSEKPVKVMIDEENRLHNPDGYAIEYADGTGIFALHGQRQQSLLDIEVNKLIKEDKGNSNA